MNEIDLCADWKDKYQISLQNRARKYIYVEYLYEIILILDLMLAAFVSRIYAIELIFPLDLTGWKRNPLQKKSSANAMVHITFIYRTMLVDVMSIVFVYQQSLLFKKNSNSIALYWRLHFDSEKIQNKSYSSFAAQAYYDIIKYQRIVETWQEVILT